MRPYQIPLGFAEIVSQAAEHLRLAPTVHWNVIPSEVQAARAERTIRLDPVFQNTGDDILQCLIQLRETVSQKQAQIDRLGTVVKLSFVNCQARRFRKWTRELIPVK